MFLNEVKSVSFWLAIIFLFFLSVLNLVLHTVICVCVISVLFVFAGAE